MDSLFILAQHVSEPRVAWAPVLLLILIGAGFAVGNLVLTSLIGPSRTGPGKEQTYESGMVPVGDTRKRFNVRFYLVAILFVAFDVEVVIMYPWAAAFPHAVIHEPHLAALMLVGMLIFTGVLVLGFLYDWGKGTFRWD